MDQKKKNEPKLKFRSLLMHCNYDCYMGNLGKSELNRHPASQDFLSVNEMRSMFFLDNFLWQLIFMYLLINM